jgi:hypothetical protein
LAECSRSPDPFEINGGEGRKGEDKGVGAALRGLLRGLLTAGVADVRAAINRGVGIEDFAIIARLRNTKAIPCAADRSGVENGNKEVLGIFAATEKAEDAIVGVVGVNPFETVPVKINLMKRGFGSVEVI